MKTRYKLHSISRYFCGSNIRGCTLGFHVSQFPNRSTLKTHAKASWRLLRCVAPFWMLPFANRIMRLSIVRPFTFRLSLGFSILRQCCLLLWHTCFVTARCLLKLGCIMHFAGHLSLIPVISQIVINGRKLCTKLSALSLKILECRSCLSSFIREVVFFTMSMIIKTTFAHV